MRILRSVTFGLIALAGFVALPASATVVVSVGAAGQSTSSVTGYNLFVDNLNGSGGGLPSLTFAGSSITGTRTSGYVNVGGANVYGGAGGTGQFGTVQGDDATFQLSQAVNYFGLWGSALDGNNSVALYNNGALLGSFALQSVLQSSSGFNSGYYGNPFGGGNSGEMYAFFNFASDSAFNEVRLIQNGGGGFEFDNLTVGTKVVSAAPEPGTWAMLLFGFGMIGMTLRGSRRTRPIAQRAAA